MPTRSQTFWRPKGGNSPEEYEDAHTADPGPGRFAIADGAAESSYSGLWARLLVEEFACPPAADTLSWAEWLPGVQARWAADVGDGPNRPWFIQSKIASGAFATFLGLVIENRDARRWQAVAVGDSCLFHLRGGALRLAFPIDNSTLFGRTPDLIGSRMSGSELDEHRSVNIGGKWEPGDRFLLMTDALSHWFLSEHEAGAEPAIIVERLLQDSIGQDAFAEWVEKLRQSGKVRNDDVTLVAVEV